MQRTRAEQGAVIFFAAWTMWILLAWPFTPDGVMISSVVAGALVVLIPAFWFAEPTTPSGAALPLPRRAFWALCYAPLFVVYCVQANLDVVYRVLHPDMPIRPGIVRIRTNLKSAVGRTTLANCITLTPGTLVIDITDEGDLYIHWIWVRTQDPEEAARRIAGRFERILARICP